MLPIELCHAAELTHTECINQIMEVLVVVLVREDVFTSVGVLDFGAGNSLIKRNLRGGVPGSHFILPNGVWLGMVGDVLLDFLQLGFCLLLSANGDN